MLGRTLDSNRAHKESRLPDKDEPHPRLFLPERGLESAEATCRPKVFDTLRHLGRIERLAFLLSDLPREVRNLYAAIRLHRDFNYRPAPRRLLRRNQRRRRDQLEQNYDEESFCVNGPTSNRVRKSLEACHSDSVRSEEEESQHSRNQANTEILRRLRLLRMTVSDCFPQHAKCGGTAAVPG